MLTRAAPYRCKHHFGGTKNARGFGLAHARSPARFTALLFLAVPLLRILVRPAALRKRLHCGAACVLCLLRTRAAAAIA